jgi:hypothetical protein
MKIAILISALIAVGCASASAADLGGGPITKAHTVFDPVYNWTGFYAGATEHSTGQEQ